MITMTYHIVYSEPRDTVLQRLSRVMEQRKYSCVPLHLGEDEGIIYKIMELSVDGKAMKLHSITNPLKQLDFHRRLDKAFRIDQ